MLSEEGLCWGLCGAAQLQTAALAQDTCPCAQKWDLQRGLWVWQFPLISADVNSSSVHLRLESTLLGPKIRYVEMLSTTVFISCCRWVLKKQKFCLPPQTHTPLAVCTLGTGWHRPLAAGQTRKDFTLKETTCYSNTLLVSKHSMWAPGHPKRGLFSLFPLDDVALKHQ